MPSKKQRRAEREARRQRGEIQHAEGRSRAERRRTGREISDPEIWSGITQESGVGFIPPTQIQQALKDIDRFQDIFSDEANPTCLFPVRHSDDNLAYPVECGKPAKRSSHSIQEAKSLREIACDDGQGRGGGLYVYQFFPDIRDAVEQTSAATPGGGRPALAQQWPWEIKELPPHPVAIANASVRHFACNCHDQDARALARADNLVVPDLPQKRTIIDDRSPPPGLEAFTESLFFLAYRTLLFRISQFRGVEQAASQLHRERSEEGNRFAVKLILGELGAIADTLTDLCRLKLRYDRRILGDSEAIHLVHHVASFRPIIRYACAEYTTVGARHGKKRWVSINVLPLQGVTWLIVSHLNEGKFGNAAIKQEIDRMLHTRRRRRVDLRMMCEFTNLYASPEDYRSKMRENDKAKISSSMSTTIFGASLSRGLEILRSSDGGQDVISRVEAKARADQ